jgi:ABC-type Mn2+/Zn2+ transport system ATPase subunit
VTRACHGPSQDGDAWALEVEGVSVHLGARRVLHDVSFRIGWGELVAVIGPNGAGKSTLFRALCGLVPADGVVAIGGAHCHHRRDRMGIAYLPQRSDLDLEFPITVGELVLAGRRRFGSWWRRPSRHDRTVADHALDRVGMVELADRRLGALSGGQMQRAFLARALAQEASIVLLDEALSGVDAPSADGLLELFRTLCLDGTTVLVATHDLALARRRFSRCLALNRTLVADGVPQQALGERELEVVFGSGRLAATMP